MAQLGVGSGPIWLYSVDCVGNEETILQCNFLLADTHRYCSHHDDVGVKCYGTKGIIIITVV